MPVLGMDVVFLDRAVFAPDADDKRQAERRCGDTHHDGRQNKDVGQRVRIGDNPFEKYRRRAGGNLAERDVETIQLLYSPKISTTFLDS